VARQKLCQASGEAQGIFEHGFEARRQGLANRYFVRDASARDLLFGPCQALGDGAVAHEECARNLSMVPVLAPGIFAAQAMASSTSLVDDVDSAQLFLRLGKGPVVATLPFRTRTVVAVDVGSSGSQPLILPTWQSLP
jgi:hypothetical protein